MPVVIEFRAGRYALEDAEALELARRLRDETMTDWPGKVVASKIDLILEQPETVGDDLQLPDSEMNALSWTIARWIEERGADGIPDGVMMPYSPSPNTICC